MCSVIRQCWPQKAATSVSFSHGARRSGHSQSLMGCDNIISKVMLTNLMGNQQIQCDVKLMWHKQIYCEINKLM